MPILLANTEMWHMAQEGRMKAKAVKDRHRDSLCEDDIKSRAPEMVARLQSLLASAASAMEGKSRAERTQSQIAVETLGRLLEKPIRASWLRQLANLVDYAEARTVMLNNLAYGAPLFGEGERKSLHAMWVPQLSSLRTFAYRCAFSRFRDWRRHLVRTRELPFAPELAQVAEVPLGGVWGCGSYGFTPDRLLEGRQLWAVVGRLIDALPPKQRQALRLRIERDMDASEIAEAMAIKPTAAHNLVKQGTGKIIAALRAAGFDPAN